MGQFRPGSPPREAGAEVGADTQFIFLSHFHIKLSQNQITIPKASKKMGRGKTFRCEAAAASHQHPSPTQLRAGLHFGFIFLDARNRVCVYVYVCVYI